MAQQTIGPPSGVSRGREHCGKCDNYNSSDNSPAMEVQVSPKNGGTP
jgi:hypothetical protein